MMTYSKIELQNKTTYCHDKPLNNGNQWDLEGGVAGSTKRSCSAFNPD